LSHDNIISIRDSAKAGNNKPIISWQGRQFGNQTFDEIFGEFNIDEIRELFNEEAL